MWETITKDLTTEPKNFVVGWNDHFFILKLELHVDMSYMYLNASSPVSSSSSSSYDTPFPFNCDDSSFISDAHLPNEE
ncbi:hypothetical protein G4B88_025558 [Cannabis sativa]|uniref:Uncharacterized protein n=1 Tax=Cannabis sativa TaxID=3483 RepID=A0A7J6F4L7_CANSA|nr:hypothetical protein G4B88_025558 [Cannabis sativa]